MYSIVQEFTLTEATLPIVIKNMQISVQINSSYRFHLNVLIVMYKHESIEKVFDPYEDDLIRNSNESALFKAY